MDHEVTAIGIICITLSLMTGVISSCDKHNRTEQTKQIEAALNRGCTLIDASKFICPEAK